MKYKKLCKNKHKNTY